MNEIKNFPGKVGLQQRVLPNYRAPFFDRLATFCLRGFNVFAGQPREVEAIQPADNMDVALHTHAANVHLLQGRYYLCYQRGLVRWLKDWDPDVLILEANPRYPANRGAIRWMQKRGRPVIGWGIGAPKAKGLFSQFQDRARSRYLSSFDALIAYSSTGAEQYAEAAIPPERIHVAINSTTLPPTSLPNRVSIRDRAPRVLFVGRLQARKRVDLLLKACAMVEPKPECWIVGDGPELITLKKIALDVFPTANFVGAKHGRELEHLFDQADLFVLPGTGGLAVQEAMAHGLPVIVAEGDGTQRDLVTMDNGWLIKTGDLEDLVQALRGAFRDPEGLLKMGAASYQIALHRANIDAMTRVFMDVINNLYGGNL